MNQDRITYLYRQYLSKSLSPSEIEELRGLLSDTGNEEAIASLLDAHWNELKDHLLLDVPGEMDARVFNSITSQPRQYSKKSTRWFRITAAASVMFGIAVAGYFYNLKAPLQAVVQIQQPAGDCLPGGNKAILTLANGKQISLTDARRGTLAQQNGINIIKANSGQIIYSSGNSNSNLRVADGEEKEVGMNKIETPKGGQYQVRLPDGTKVWLNAASAIRYPVRFAGNERRIELVGEAYFEVVHNSKQPFKVVTSNQQVEVLGTHFNINAYADETAVETTLLEGSVKVTSSTGLSKTIKPGEQIQLENGKMNWLTVDPEEVIAWKNGMFYFNKADLKAVMRQISRWYDVDIAYEGKIPSRKFSGQISKNINVSQLLEILAFKKIQYTISNKTILIKSK